MCTLCRSEFNIYRRVLEHASKAADGDWDGFADGLAADVNTVKETLLTEERMKTTKNRYDPGVTASHFEYIDAQTKAAAEVVAKAKPGDEPKVVSLIVPWVDAGAAPVLAGAAAGAASSEAPDAETAAVVDDAAESDIESMFGKKKKKNKKKKGAGATAAAAMNAAGKAMGGKTPSLDAVLSQLVKKQAEPTFPDVDEWTRGRGGGGGGSGGIAQATGSEAIAAASAFALATAPTGATVVAPSALFASALTFDLETLGGGGRVVDAAATATATAVEAKADAPAVFIVFDPPGDAAGVGSDADLAAAVAKARDAGSPVVVCTVAMAPGGSCDATKGTAGADQAGVEAVARATARAKI